ncbi:hypothetical protein GGX14DRAFT_594107 [Mycena pura]|uniref:Uncharacterized protein n=1 Tax=Mycena pura TaxID=153505 RepID=A0AAD6UU15_9AGAR|nr:hypothetical protein GGX14DRAFT_594107 [Mycena pura]
MPPRSCHDNVCAAASRRYKGRTWHRVCWADADMDVSAAYRMLYNLRRKPHRRCSETRASASGVYCATLYSPRRTPARLCRRLGPAWLVVCVDVSVGVVIDDLKSQRRFRRRSPRRTYADVSILRLVARQSDALDVALPWTNTYRLCRRLGSASDYTLYSPRQTPTRLCRRLDPAPALNETAQLCRLCIMDASMLDDCLQPDLRRVYSPTGTDSRNFINETRSSGTAPRRRFGRSQETPVAVLEVTKYGTLQEHEKPSFSCLHAYCLRRLWAASFRHSVLLRLQSYRSSKRVRIGRLRSHGPLMQNLRHVPHAVTLDVSQRNTRASTRRTFFAHSLPKKCVPAHIYYLK